MLINNLSNSENSSTKLHHRQETRLFIRRMKQAGQRVIIVTGCFDLLHKGHVQFLKRAKANGDILVVGIEDDMRVRAFKGPSRPVNSIIQRVEVMESLAFVDFVFVISGSPKTKPKRFYANLRRWLGADALAISEGDPDSHAKKEQIEAVGGELITCSFINNTSTTSILHHFLSRLNINTQFIIRQIQ